VCIPAPTLCGSVGVIMNQWIELVRENSICVYMYVCMCVCVCVSMGVMKKSLGGGSKILSLLDFFGLTLVVCMHICIYIYVYVCIESTSQQMVFWIWRVFVRPEKKKGLLL